MRIRTLSAGIALVVAALFIPSRLQGLILTDCIGDSGNFIVYCDDPGAPPAQAASVVLQPVTAAPVAIAPDTFATTVGDLDGDGRSDLIAVAQSVPGDGGSPLKVMVKRADGNGGFGAATETLASQTRGSNLHTAIGDVNGDGRPDLVVTMVNSGSSAGGFDVFLNTGGGNLSLAHGYLAPPTSQLAKTPQNIAIGDVTGDGKPDVVMLSSGIFPDYLDVWVGDGTGEFSLQQQLRWTSLTAWGQRIVTTALALADVNGDGALDFLTNGEGAMVSYNDGAGTFAPPVGIGTIDSYVQGIGVSIATADLNGDGFEDVVYFDGLQFRVTLNSAGGFVSGTSLYQAVPSVTRSVSTSMALADMNGDGHLDAVALVAEADDALGTASSSVSIAFGDGAGGFSNPAFYPLPGTTIQVELGTFGGAIAVGDLNGDGKADVVGTLLTFVNFNQSLNYSVLLQPPSDPILPLSNAVTALGLPNGTDNSLQAKLNGATASLAGGNKKAAANQLNAFINAVNALKKSRRLPAVQADALIALAQQVIAGL